MRTRIVVVVLALLVAAAQPGGVPGWPENMVLKAQICVERPGDMGRLNLRPADVVIEGGPLLRMIGEQAACGYVQPGKYRVWAQSTDPFDRSSTKIDAWKSASIIVSVGAKERIELEVCGLGANGTYTNWKVERVANRCH